MEERYRREDEEVEIDLRQLAYALRRRIWLIVLIGILFAGTSGILTNLIITPKYTSNSMILVLTKETTLASLADLQMGSQLTKDYTVLITSRPALEEVIARLSMDLNYKQLREQITISNPADTRILELSVEDENPIQAKLIVDALAEVSSEYIGDKMEVTPPKILEQGEVSEEQTSPNLLKNILVGLLLGIIMASGLIIVLELLNDSIRTEDDIERYLGVPMLAVVPDKALEGDLDSSRKEKRKRKRAEVQKNNGK